MDIHLELGILVHCLRSCDVMLREEHPYDITRQFRALAIYHPGDSISEDAILFCHAACMPDDGPYLVFCVGEATERPAEKVYDAHFTVLGVDSPEKAYLQVMSCLTDYLSWNVAAGEIIRESKGLQKLVHISERYFPFPLAVFNEIGEVIATTTTIESSYPPFCSLIREGHMPSEIFTRLTSPLINLRAVYSGQEHGSYIGRAMIGENAINLYRSCFLDDRIIYRCCFFCQNLMPTPEFQRFVEVFFRFLDRFIEHNRKLFEGDMGGEAYLLKTLVTGSYADRDFLVQNLQQHNIPLKGNYLLVNISLDAPDFQHTEQVRQSLCAAGNLKCFLYGGGVVALIDLQTKNRELLTKLSYYMSRIDQLLQQYRGIAGVSNNFEDIFSIFNAYLQTEKALELGRQLQPISSPSRFFQGRTRILHYKEVFAYHLLNDIGNWAITENSVARDLLRYMERSRLSKEEILKTLYVHIAHGCRYNVTAQVLSLHRNTVANRIEQIEQELYISLDNFEDCINVILAIKAIECGLAPPHGQPER